MPKKGNGASLSHRTANAARMRNTRAQRNEEQIQQENENERERIAQLRQSESEDVRVGRNKRKRLEPRQAYRQSQQVHRLFTSDLFLRLPFAYEPDIQYYAHSKVVIGAMDKECPHCNALKFKNETAGMVCASGKVLLPAIEAPPEPLNGLLNFV